MKRSAARKQAPAPPPSTPVLPEAERALAEHKKLDKQVGRRVGREDLMIDFERLELRIRATIAKHDAKRRD